MQIPKTFYVLKVKHEKKCTGSLLKGIPDVYDRNQNIKYYVILFSAPFSKLY